MGNCEMFLKNLVRIAASTVMLSWIVACGGGISESRIEQNLSTDGTLVVNHPEYFFYSVNMTIGGKVFSDILLDTGSSNLIVIGDRRICPDCTPTAEDDPTYRSQPYTPSSSPLFGGQTFNIRYATAEGDVRLYQERIAFESQGSEIDYPLGVFTDGERIQNILGLGYPANLASVEDFSPLPFFDQFAIQNDIPNLFAINICPDGLAGNFMTIGRIAEGIPADSIRYTPILPNSLLRERGIFDFYNIGPIDLRVEGEDSPLAYFVTQEDRYLTFVDSGAYFMYLPESMIQAIGSYYQRTLGIPETFWDLNDDVSKIETIDASFQSRLKPLLVTFPQINGGTFEVAISPATYTIRVLLENGKVALVSGFKSLPPPKQLHDGYIPGVVIFGDIFMQNVHTVFDRESQRLGFSSNDTLCTNANARMRTGVMPLFKSKKRFMPRSP
ncbi:A1 family peptidase [bacterium]|nr:MAG: A1 family peptidase [bacterium]